MESLKSFSRHIVAALLILMIMAGLYSIIVGREAKKPETLTLSEVVGAIKGGNIKNIEIKGNDLKIVFGDDSVKEAKKESDASLTDTLANYGLSKEEISKVGISIKEPSGFLFWIGNILPFLAPIIIILVFFWLASRQVKGASGQAFSFGQSRARIALPDDQKPKTTFKDVAGVKEAKEELLEIVDFLRSPEKFLSIGAKIPKGVLLMGAPGTGKTLLARAVAGEAEVPFFHISGSEFVEMFVGVGASRVRDLFKMAKRAAPAIIFIDEIDAVGRHRGSGMGGGHDEREQTLNQILVEMDGFEPTEKVIVMAGTNRPDVLDPALLRPGRFDRRVILDLPDIKEREEILQIHSVGKPLAKDIVLRVIAERTPGFSGADLMNLMNEAAILTARQNRKEVEQDDLIRSIEKVMLGPERKSRLLTAKEKKITAYHEAGHALVSSVLPHADPVHKVSVVSRGRAAGYTLKLPLEEKHLHSRAHFLDDLAVSMGGFVAEKLIFGDMTTGASNDIRVSSDLARAVVTKYGMSEKIGPVAYGEDEPALFLGKDFGHGKNYSEETAKEIDAEVTKLMKDAERRARDVITKHKDALEAITKTLMEKETIEQADYEKIISSFGITPKRVEIV